MAHTSRRTLLRMSLATGAVALLPGRIEAAKREPGPETLQGEEAGGYDAVAVLTRSLMAQHLGSTFLLTRRRLLPLRLVLLEVGDPLAAEEAGLLGSETSFIAVFAGPAGAPLRQGIQHLRHPQLGDLDLFLVPLGRPRKVQLYAAAFDRRTRG